MADFTRIHLQKRQKKREMEMYTSLNQADEILEKDRSLISQKMQIQ